MIIKEYQLPDGSWCVTVRVGGYESEAIHPDYITAYNQAYDAASEAANTFPKDPIQELKDEIATLKSDVKKLQDKVK